MTGLTNENYKIYEYKQLVLTSTNFTQTISFDFEESVDLNEPFDLLMSVEILNEVSMSIGGLRISYIIVESSDLPLVKHSGTFYSGFQFPRHYENVYLIGEPSTDDGGRMERLFVLSLDRENPRFDISFRIPPCYSDMSNWDALITIYAVKRISRPVNFSLTEDTGPFI